MSKREKEFSFTENHFQLLKKYIYDHAGIALADTKKELVYSRLSRRLRALGLNSFDDYCEVLSKGDNKQELMEFTNAITTNLTSFFREKHHFDMMQELILPKITHATDKADKVIRVWCSAASTGEEPYTIAIVLHEFLAQNPGWQATLVATDLDSNVLAKAKQGVYPIRNIESVPEPLIKKWFDKGKGDKEGLCRVKPQLSEFINFRELNLMHPYPFKEPFDIIFCRNVLIYFDNDTQKTVVDKFANLLPLGRFLVLGHSETVANKHPLYRTIGQTVFERVANGQ